MKIDILTLFPEMFRGPFDESIVKRAQTKSLVEIKIHNLRDWTEDKRNTVDDKPYGGGVGMVLMVEPIYRALQTLKPKDKNIKSRIILFSAGGKVFNQNKAQEFSKIDHLTLICGHYEGVDQRVTDYLIDEEVSIGNYVLTGGEIPAMVVVDAVTRLIPGVLEKPEATELESFSNYPLTPNRYPLLEYPQYTRPEDFRGWKVPEILLSGNHQKIEEWRLEKSLEKTRKTRPDLLKE